MQTFPYVHQKYIKVYHLDIKTEYIRFSFVISSKYLLCKFSNVANWNVDKCFLPLLCVYILVLHPSVTFFCTFGTIKMCVLN